MVIVASGVSAVTVISRRRTMPSASTQAVALTIAVYCPDRLSDYLSHLDTLKLDDTTK